MKEACAFRKVTPRTAEHRAKLLASTTSAECIRKRLSKVCARPNIFEAKCLRHLNTLYPDKFKYTGDGSFMVAKRSADAYSKELKIVCLFQGDYFHCNPRKFKAVDYNELLKMTAEEIWKRDARAIEIFKEAGYKVLIIWEDEIDKLLEAK